MPITDVKGRWYESSTLLPILKGPADFSRDLQRGEVGDAGQWMNARGDCNVTAGNNALRTGTRHVDRLEAFGKSIPAGTRISRGLDGPPEDQVFPEVPVATAVGQGHGEPMQGVEDGKVEVKGVSDGDIAQFMDLDRMEEGYV